MVWREIEIWSIAWVAPGFYFACVHLWNLRRLPRRLFWQREPLAAIDIFMAGMGLMAVMYLFNSFFWGSHFFAGLMQWAPLREATYHLGPLANLLTRNPGYSFGFFLLLVAQYRANPGRVSPWVHFAIGTALLLASVAALHIIAP